MSTAFHVPTKGGGHTFRQSQLSAGALCDLEIMVGTQTVVALAAADEMLEALGDIKNALLADEREQAIAKAKATYSKVCECLAWARTVEEAR